MPLPCYVQMEDEGIVDQDDSSFEWHKTAVQLTVAGLLVQAKVLTDWYSGSQTLRILRDDVGLDRPVLKTLLLEAFNISSGPMMDCSSDTGEAFFDLERLINRLFYRTQASEVIRQITTA